MGPRHGVLAGRDLDGGQAALGTHPLLVGASPECCSVPVSRWMGAWLRTHLVCSTRDGREERTEVLPVDRPQEIIRTMTVGLGKGSGQLPVAGIGMEREGPCVPLQIPHAEPVDGLPPQGRTPRVDLVLNLGEQLVEALRNGLVRRHREPPALDGAPIASHKPRGEELELGLGHLADSGWTVLRAGEGAQVLGEQWSQRGRQVRRVMRRQGR